MEAVEVASSCSETHSNNEIETLCEYPFICEKVNMMFFGGELRKSAHVD